MNEKLAQYDAKMKKAYNNLEVEFAAIRAGRANPHILDKIKVDYYGTPTPLQQVGNISVPEPRLIQIIPWDKNLIKDISRAIQSSDIGINPTNDGLTIRLVFPELTEDRRKELVKEIKKKGEANKIAIRNARRDGNEAFKKLDISEDEIADLEEGLQKLTDKYIKDLEQLVEEKSQEILKV